MIQLCNLSSGLSIWLRNVIGPLLFFFLLMHDIFMWMNLFEECFDIFVGKVLINTGLSLARI